MGADQQPETVFQFQLPGVWPLNPSLNGFHSPGSVHTSLDP